MKYRVVIELNGKTFKDTKIYDEPYKHFAEKEARRLNQLREIKAYVEALGEQSA